jgi:hypoxanthine phosphoribosyltransferase
MSKIIPLYGKKQIKDRVHALGKEIIHEFLPAKEITVVSVLTGSLVFTADLIRHFDSLQTHVEFVKAARVGVGQSMKPFIDWSLLKRHSIEKKHVLLVDDIVDTGRTLAEVREGLMALNPITLKTSVLLRKRGTQLPRFKAKPDFIGFDNVKNVFVVGYGLDYLGLHRNLSWIGYLPDTSIQ